MAGESAAGYARLKGEGGGANLLLYAPIDTHLEGDERQPWVGPKVTADLLPRRRWWTLGFWLGSSNPKAMVATLAEVFRCVERPMCPFLAICLSGLPMEACRSPFQRGGMLVSNGILHLLNRGGSPDFCIIMKPWNWVYHEEPGMAWFKVTVWGSLGYAGCRGYAGVQKLYCAGCQSYFGSGGLVADLYGAQYIGRREARWLDFGVALWLAGAAGLSLSRHRDLF